MVVQVGPRILLVFAFSAHAHQNAHSPDGAYATNDPPVPYHPTNISFKF